MFDTAALGPLVGAATAVCTGMVAIAASAFFVYMVRSDTLFGDASSAALLSVITIGICVGFLPWNDPRVVGTVEAVRRELSVDGFLLRYDQRVDGDVDGLPGDEAAFLVCTVWLVDGLHGIGKSGEAVELFESLLALRNDLGLLSEEYDPRAGRQLGNTPQAFSHIGLVNSARRLSAPGVDPLAAMAEGR